MKWLFALIVGFAPLLVSVGCGDSRPDPRANPDFDEEAYSDPGAAALQMQQGGGDEGAQ